MHYAIAVAIVASCAFVAFVFEVLTIVAYRRLTNAARTKYKEDVRLLGECNRFDHELRLVHRIGIVISNVGSFSVRRLSTLCSAGDDDRTKSSQRSGIQPRSRDACVPPAVLFLHVRRLLLQWTHMPMRNQVLLHTLRFRSGSLPSHCFRPGL